MNRVVRPKARSLIAQTWQSQANLTLFLLLLALTVFVLPAVGVKRERLEVYSDAVYTLIVLSGAAVGWRRPRLFWLALCVAVPAVAVRWYSCP